MGQGDMMVEGGNEEYRTIHRYCEQRMEVLLGQSP